MFLVELGVGRGPGVMLDTMIVRLVLVTALNLDLGGKIWWPSKLDRTATTRSRRAREPDEEKAWSDRSDCPPFTAWAGESPRPTRSLA